MVRYTEVVVLCEDLQQEVFCRKFLTTCGINRHRIRYRRSPSGSAEQFVRKQYPKEVRAFRRSCAHKANVALVVMVDADVLTVDERRRQLSSALADTGEEPRRNNERIGVFVPKRNIETWIRYIEGESVNEVDTYSKLDNQSECKQAVECLVRIRGQSLPADAPPSLTSSCSELSRIL